MYLTYLSSKRVIHVQVQSACKPRRPRICRTGSSAQAWLIRNALSTAPFLSLNHWTQPVWVFSDYRSSLVLKATAPLLPQTSVLLKPWDYLAGVFSPLCLVIHFLLCWDYLVQRHDWYFLVRIALNLATAWTLKSLIHESCTDDDDDAVCCSTHAASASMMLLILKA